MVKCVTIKNTSNQTRVRFGRAFPGGRTISVDLDVDNKSYRQITSCSSLKILSIEDIVADVAEVEAPPAESSGEETIAEVGDVKEDPTVLEIQSAPSPNVPDSPEPEPLVLPDADELPCPYCDAKASKKGLYHHVRIKHPDQYLEFKARLKKV